MFNFLVITTTSFRRSLRIDEDGHNTSIQSESVSDSEDMNDKVKLVAKLGQGPGALVEYLNII